MGFQIAAGFATGAVSVPLPLGETAAATGTVPEVTAPEVTAQKVTTDVETATETVVAPRGTGQDLGTGQAVAASPTAAATGPVSLTGVGLRVGAASLIEAPGEAVRPMVEVGMTSAAAAVSATATATAVAVAAAVAAATGTVRGVTSHAVKVRVETVCVETVHGMRGEVDIATGSATAETRVATAIVTTAAVATVATVAAFGVDRVPPLGLPTEMVPVTGPTVTVTGHMVTVTGRTVTTGIVTGSNITRAAVTTGTATGRNGMSRNGMTSMAAGPSTTILVLFTTVVMVTQRYRRRPRSSTHPLGREPRRGRRCLQTSTPARSTARFTSSCERWPAVLPSRLRCVWWRRVS